MNVGGESRGDQAPLFDRPSHRARAFAAHQYAHEPAGPARCGTGVVFGSDVDDPASAADRNASERGAVGRFDPPLGTSGVDRRADDGDGRDEHAEACGCLHGSKRRHSDRSFRPRGDHAVAISQPLNHVRLRAATARMLHVFRAIVPRCRRYRRC